MPWNINVAWHNNLLLYLKCHLVFFFFLQEVCSSLPPDGEYPSQPSHRDTIIADSTSFCVIRYGGKRTVYKSPYFWGFLAHVHAVATRPSFSPPHLIKIFFRFRAYGHARVRNREKEGLGTRLAS